MPNGNGRKTTATVLAAETVARAADLAQSTAELASGLAKDADAKANSLATAADKVKENVDSNSAQLRGLHKEMIKLRKVCRLDTEKLDSMQSKIDQIAEILGDIRPHFAAIKAAAAKGKN